MQGGATRAGTRFRRPPKPFNFEQNDTPTVSSLPNLSTRRSINSGTHGMGSDKRSGTDGDEVGVIPPPRKLSKIHPDYFTINVPQVYRLTAAAANILYASTTPLATIRLNSIYDPLKAARATLNNPSTQSDVQPTGS